MAALFVRNNLMDMTRSKDNCIPFDREAKPKTVNDFLPDALK